MRLLFLEYFKTRSRFMVQICIILWLMVTSYVCSMFIMEEAIEVDNMVIPGLFIDNALEHREAMKYAGVLTDEKVQQMYDEQGLASINEFGLPSGNYCSEFLTKYMLPPGAADDISKGQAPVPLRTVAESFPEVIGSGEEVVFGYPRGWNVVLGASSLFAVFGCIILILITAPVFTEEKESRADILIITSCHGNYADVHAKMGVTAGYVLFLFTTFLIPKLISGSFVCTLDGWEASACMLGQTSFLGTVGNLVTGYFAILLTGFLFTASLTFCISSFCRYTLTAAALSALFILGPWAYVMLTGTGSPVSKLLAAVTPQVWMTTWNAPGSLIERLFKSITLLFISAAFFLIGKRRFKKGYMR